MIAGTGTAGFRGDGGAATEARLNSPGDLAFDSTGNLLIADRGNNRIRRVSPEGTIQTIAGSSGSFSYVDISGELATDVGLGPIDGLAVDSQDNIYISEYSRISVIDKQGRIYIVTGLVSEDDDGVRSYIDGPLNGCDGLAVDSDGRLYFSVREDGRVMVAVPKSLNEGAVISHTNFGGFPSVAPGTWMEIYGSDLAGTSRQWAYSDFVGGTAPTSLDGVRVVIGGQDAFVAYISPGAGERSSAIQYWSRPAAGYRNGRQQNGRRLQRQCKRDSAWTVRAVAAQDRRKAVCGRVHFRRIHLRRTIRRDSRRNFASGPAGRDDCALRHRIRLGDTARRRRPSCRTEQHPGPPDTVLLWPDAGRARLCRAGWH